MSHPSESEIQNLTMVALSSELSALVIRCNAGTFRPLVGEGVIKGAPAGTSDLIACIRGLFFAVEIKTATGRQTPQQQKFEAAVRKRGGVYILARDPRDAVAQVRAVLATHAADRSQAHG